MGAGDETQVLVTAQQALTGLNHLPGPVLFIINNSDQWQWLWLKDLSQGQWRDSVESLYCEWLAVTA